MTNLRILHAGLAGALIAFGASEAAAQNWPTRAVSVISPFTAGNASDLVGRVVLDQVSKQVGQPFVLENRPGGGGTIGGQIVVTARPDGYTLMLSNTTPISISPLMLDKPPYDAVKGFTHAFYIGSVPNVFVLHPSVPAKNMTELVAYLRKPPKPVNYGSGGIGSIGHIVGELFKNNTAAKMEHVGYKGSSPMHADLLGGHILVAVDSLPQNVPYMQSGKLRGIAVTSPARMKMAPDVPTVVELGYPKLVAENFLGISGPAGLPGPVIDRIHKAMTEVVARSDFVSKLDELGVQGRPMTPAEFGSFVQKQVVDWGPAVKASGAKLN